VSITDDISAEKAKDPRLTVKYDRWTVPDDDYRASAAHIAAFQSLAELIGVLPFAEWVPYAPDITRKQMLLAKVQDEVGHGHVMARVAEDLGVTREQILGDFVEGRTKLLNIFHYRFERWEEIGPAALLMNSAAIVQFQSLKNGTYLPYVRALRKIETEEGFHYHRAMDDTYTILVRGTEEQRRIVQEAFETWLVRVLAYFGPPDSTTIAENHLYRLGLKVDSNDDLRQRWLSKIIPVFERIGVEVRPDLASFDPETARWSHVEPDWAEVRRTIKEGGPAYERWRAHIDGSIQRNAPYRDAALRAA
jgi:ring-1,2-phenylacetyl-CoA epoxidase subunit PaaA